MILKSKVFIVKEVAGRKFESPIEDAQTMRRTILIMNKINPRNCECGMLY